MPKQKTRKAAAKRFEFTKSGKVKRRRAGKRHLQEWKSSSSKRAHRRTAYVSKSDIHRIKTMLPGGR